MPGRLGLRQALRPGPAFRSARVFCMRILLAPEAGSATLAPPTCISGRLRCLLLSCGAIWLFWLHLGRVKNMAKVIIMFRILYQHIPQRGHVVRVWAYDAQWRMSYDHKRHNM